MLKDKRAIVTGSASGIGLAVAQLLSEKGAKVVMADINEEALKSTPRPWGLSIMWQIWYRRCRQQGTG